MKKTLILVPDLKLPGGVTNYYKTLRLDDEKLITYFPITATEQQKALIASFRLFIKYFKFIYKATINKYEVVIVNPSLDKGRSFYRDMVFIIITKLLNKKAIVFFRGWFEPYEEKIKKSKWKKFLFKISYAKADKYIVLGNIFKNKLIGLGVPAKTEFFIETTVANSRDINELNINEKHCTYQDEIKFLFLSRMEKEKGIYIAIDAFKSYLDKNPTRKSILIIAGDGPDLQAVKKYVEDLNLSCIKFLGHVGSLEKKSVLLQCHVMIFPSFTEGLPNSILEGMLYGMPIVARATGGIPEVIKQNINGFITESFDSAIFAEYLSAIALDENLYKTISETNYQTALQRFTSEKVRERIINIL